MSRVLVIGDTHFPAVRPGYRQFCEDLAEKFDCNKFVHIGDVIDFHAISEYDSEPDAPGALDEYEAALSHVYKWYSVWPNMIVTEGNHDRRPYRGAAKAKMPHRFVKGYNELFGTSGWKWLPDIVIDGAYYFHGTGTSGQYPAMNTMTKMLMPTVQGHVHSAAGLWWKTNPERRMFGMNVGCGVDDKHVAFKYGEHLKVRSVMAAGVVIDGTPQHFIMPCGEGEKYHRNRFKKGKP
jgi:predicted phosphodiesterase